MGTVTQAIKDPEDSRRLKQMLKQLKQGRDKKKDDSVKKAIAAAIREVISRDPDLAAFSDAVGTAIGDKVKNRVVKKYEKWTAAVQKWESGGRRGKKPVWPFPGK